MGRSVAVVGETVSVVGAAVGSLAHWGAKSKLADVVVAVVDALESHASLVANERTVADLAAQRSLASAPAPARDEPRDHARGPRRLPRAL